MLKGNESAQTFIDMINAEKLSYESAKAGGMLSEAELYHQRAELLRQGLYELEARNGRDISDIVNARGNDAGKWEAYTLEVAREDALKDGIIDSRETAIIHNKREQYSIAVQTGKNGMHYDTPYSDAGVYNITEYNNDNIEAQRLANAKGMDNGEYTTEKVQPVDYSIYVLAGINSTTDTFNDFVEELKKKYAAEGKVVEINVYCPYGTKYEVKLSTQAFLVQYDMSVSPENSIGGQNAKEYVESNYSGGDIIIVGHSGGGIVGYNAAQLLEEDGYNVHEVVQVGSPKMPIKDEWKDRVSHISSESGPFILQFDPVTGIGDWGPMSAGKPDKVTTVDTVKTGWGSFQGHTNYFESTQFYKKGISNLNKTIEAMWEWIR